MQGGGILQSHARIAITCKNCLLKDHDYRRDRADRLFQSGFCMNKDKVYIECVGTCVLLLESLCRRARLCLSELWEDWDG